MIHRVDCICNNCDLEQQIYFGVAQELDELIAIENKLMGRNERGQAYKDLENKYDLWVWLNGRFGN